jgi:RNA-binding protein YhbY
MSAMNFQIGKKGITKEVILTLATAFETHKQIRISALKSSGRNRESITAMAEQIKSMLPTPVVYKIIGFTIIMSRSRRAR